MKHKDKNNSENHEQMGESRQGQTERHDMHEELHNIRKELHEMKEQFEQMQKEKADIFAQLQRVSADYINYQKRIGKQISDTTAYEKESVIKSLLPVMDNFEHALAKGPTAETANALMKGMQIVYDQIVDILKLHGVEQIKALGQQFDPEIHSAVTQASDPSRPENIVLNEIARGYKLSGRVIRPAKVVVNRPAGGATAQPEQQPPEEPAANDETTDTQ
jgi:molecular chaperone GrpE